MVNVVPQFHQSAVPILRNLLSRIPAQRGHDSSARSKGKLAALFPFSVFDFPISNYTYPRSTQILVSGDSRMKSVAPFTRRQFLSDATRLSALYALAGPLPAFSSSFASRARMDQTPIVDAG